MLNPEALKATAAKLIQAPKSDRLWILKQLPTDVAQSLQQQVKELESLGIENPQALGHQVDFSLVTDETMRLVLDNYQRLSAAELFLYSSLLDSESRATFESQIDTGTRNEMQRFASRRKMTAAPKFKSLFLSALVKACKGS